MINSFRLKQNKIHRNVNVVGLRCNVSVFILTSDSLVIKLKPSERGKARFL